MGRQYNRRGVGCGAADPSDLWCANWNGDDNKHPGAIAQVHRRLQYPERHLADRVASPSPDRELYAQLAKRGAFDFAVAST